MRDVLPMWAAAMLTITLRPGEADHLGKLTPVDGVKPAVLRSDRHEGSLSPAPRRGNPDVGLVCGAVLPERQYPTAEMLGGFVTQALLT